MDLLDHVLALPVDRGGLAQGESLLVAVSGGVDSTVLLHVLARARAERGLRLEVAHLDHGLRGDSARDADLAAQMADRLGLRFHTQRLEPRDFPRRLGPEAAARTARYAWLRTVRAREGLQRIATAHHFDDHVESLLLSLGRGAGLTAMRGIAPSRGDLVRPLRQIRRTAITDYAEQHGLAHRDDPTNDSARFRRNRVRHELLPLFTDIFEGDVAARIAGFAERLQGDLAALESAAELALTACADQRSPGRIEVDRQRWRGLDRVLQFHALRRMLREIQGPTLSQRWNESSYRRVLDSVEKARSGTRFPLPGGGWLRIGRLHLVICGPGVAETPEFALSEEVLPATGDVVTFPGVRSACFDADRVQPPLTLRSVEPGDRIHPPGMRGRKKLTAFFRERDISADERPSMLVVEDAERIIWAVGIITAEETQPTPQTKRILRLSVGPVDRREGRA